MYYCTCCMDKGTVKLYMTLYLSFLIFRSVRSGFNVARMQT